MAAISIRKKKHGPHTKAQRARIYVDSEGNQLAAMAETMWQLRNAMQPQQVMDRAKLKRSTFWNGLRSKYGDGHFVWDYLYGKPLPDDAQLIFESNHGGRGLRRSLKPHEAYITKDMMQFRREASLKPTCQFLKRSARDGFTDSAFAYWRRLFADVAWYEGWQFYYEDAPSNVALASEAEVRRMRTATNYSEFLRATRAMAVDYGEWIDLFPLAELVAWMHFLYGGPTPPGRYVVPEWLVALKSRLSPAGVTRAAGNSASFQLNCTF